jgi:hypothetical protein
MTLLLITIRKSTSFALIFCLIFVACSLSFLPFSSLCNCCLFCNWGPPCLCCVHVFLHALYRGRCYVRCTCILTRFWCVANTIFHIEWENVNGFDNMVIKLPLKYSYVSLCVKFCDSNDILRFFIHTIQKRLLILIFKQGNLEISYKGHIFRQLLK